MIYTYYMETLLSKKSTNTYSISRVPFYSWVSKNLPQFKEVTLLEIDSVDFEIWDSIYKNFTSSEIIISSSIKSRINAVENMLYNLPIRCQVEHSYELSFLNNSLDLVLSNNNNFIDCKKTLNEVSRVLKEGGLFLNFVNGNNHITQFKELFYRGLGVHRDKNNKRNTNTMNNKYEKVFKSVNFREYSRTLHLKNPNDILGYYLSNRNPKVRNWALEDSSWIIKEVNREIKENGYFKVDINHGMFVCKK